ncbi:Sec-independent protein translocase protein TatB [Nocardia fluminea]|uniref:Sec-independent protein translocase protein TatB n=1 Tax=Nocardia fluminea TaxID=134984 RepID=A0A2N3WWE8_9NOCA|nr:Sec-independent protein translocase protein TatB [Nocardia fluminea]PKV98187.1 sec-independent protein translocase protein TatB [Nocardia fluminea]
MFSNIGWSETIILVVAALIIIGPERLPGALRWTIDSMRQLRDFAGGATTHLKQQIGPEFEELRKPLAELNKMRGMSPRSLLTQHLFDGDDSMLRDIEGALPTTDDLNAVGKPGPGASATEPPASSVPHGWQDTDYT